MNPTFSIFVVATLLLAPTSAEAAWMGNSNLILPPPSPSISTAPPQTNAIGGANQGIAPGLPEINPITGQAFGASPGQPGSPTYDPNAALPSLNNAGSALGAAGSANLTPSGTSGGM
jgi:hypothetical protein